MHGLNCLGEDDDLGLALGALTVLLSLSFDLTPAHQKTRNRYLPFLLYGSQSLALLLNAMLALKQMQTSTIPVVHLGLGTYII